MGCHREIHSDRAQRSELQAHRETLFDVQNLFMCASRFAHTYTRTLTHTKTHTRTQCHKRNQCTHTHIGIYLTCQQPGKIGSVPAIILPFLLNIARLYDSEPRTEARVHKDGDGPGFLYRLISVERKLNQGERKLALVVLAGRLRNQTLADVETMNKKKTAVSGAQRLFSLFLYSRRAAAPISPPPLPISSFISSVSILLPVAALRHPFSRSFPPSGLVLRSDENGCPLSATPAPFNGSVCAYPLLVTRIR